jgi:hypothetical protein
MTIKRRILNVLISFDQFIFSVITLGWSFPDETISSALYRYEQKGSRFAHYGRRFVDWLFTYIEDNHCYQSYLAEFEGKQRPYIAEIIQNRKNPSA